MLDDTLQRTHKKLLKIILRHIPFFILSLYIAGMSSMAFDAPGSEKNLLIWLTVLPIFIMPLSLLISIIGGGLCYSLKKYTCVSWLIKIPKYNLYLVFIGIVITIVAGLL